MKTFLRGLMYVAIGAGAWLTVIAVGFAIARLAMAHDWFTDLRDPVTNLTCCTGPSDPKPDCKAVPEEMMKSGVITEVPGGYQVRLTVEQGKYFNKNTAAAIDEFIEWKRVAPGMASGFAICVFQSSVRCMFGPANT